VGKIYEITEIYLTIQGEGINTGRVACFCRFAGCNLWSGKEADRKDAQCRFCDTDFRIQERYEAEGLAEKIRQTAGGCKFVVFTGGEPTLQLDAALIDLLQPDFEIAIETNGTLPTPRGVDWICVSPKAGTRLRQKRGNELKLVYRQEGCEPEDFEEMEFDHFLLQPCDGPYRAYDTEAAIEYCKQNPKWRLSLQTHKFVGLR
jgi:7-carboxy-7-deazaguanine synthase (Cx14CxxC type)